MIKNNVIATTKGRKQSHFWNLRLLLYGPSTSSGAFNRNDVTEGILIIFNQNQNNHEKLFTIDCTLPSMAYGLGTGGSI
ncbi:hypothetical protein [Echinicola sp. 20G]|uniref:hypothetical protein n=1 Tax=Echinicola sp. 20G TaxID=2781961 RepID=UPI001910873A|nr:hypothetical protein [Echinicola sp. 20G]